jgi:hypothetical protein
MTPKEWGSKQELNKHGELCLTVMVALVLANKIEQRKN